MGIRGEFSARRQRLFYIFLFHGHYGGEKGDVASRINSVRLFLTYVSVRYSDTLKISQVSRDKKCRKNSISVNIYKYKYRDDKETIHPSSPCRTNSFALITFGFSEFSEPMRVSLIALTKYRV